MKGLAQAGRRGGPAQAAGPPRRSLGYMGYRTARPFSQIRLFSLRAFARTVLGQPKHAKKTASGLFWPRGSDQSAHIHGRADGQRKKKMHHRAHEEIQAVHTARTIRSKIVWAVPMMIGFPLFRTGHWKVKPQPIYARFGRCSRSEPKNVPQGLFCMFRLAEHSPRETLLAELSIMTQRMSCGLCHRAEDPRGRGTA